MKGHQNKKERKKERTHPIAATADTDTLGAHGQGEDLGNQDPCHRA